MLIHTLWIYSDTSTGLRELGIKAATHQLVEKVSTLKKAVQLCTIIIMFVKLFAKIYFKNYNVKM